MFTQNKHFKSISGRIALLLCSCAIVIVLACSVSQLRKVSERGATQDKSTELIAKPVARRLPNAPAKDPLSRDAIATMRMAIVDASNDFSARLEARRALMQALRRHDRLSEAMGELHAILDDVETEEGRTMAQRVAIAEAGMLHQDASFEAAALAYQMILDRYPDSGFIVEAAYHMGECRLEQGRYEEAEQVWRELTERHPDAWLTPWAFRKVALAQLLQKKFDDSLATLGQMETRFEGTEFGDYARMRKGYVQLAAGKKDEAQKTYSKFLASCPTSKYCRLVQKQIAELDHPSALVGGTR